MVIGAGLDGMKDVLDIWFGAMESSRYWLTVFNELKNRGIEDILIASVDGLPGFVEAINTAFPKMEDQGCLIHQIRNSTKYVSYKDLERIRYMGQPPRIQALPLWMIWRRSGDLSILLA